MGRTTRHTAKVYATPLEEDELKRRADAAHLSLSRYLLLKGLDALPRESDHTSHKYSAERQYEGSGWEN